MYNDSLPTQDRVDVFDPARKFVKVTRVNSRGFVEFEFAVGIPELCVELMLPSTAFEAFCRAQNAVRLDTQGEPIFTRSTQ